MKKDRVKNESASIKELDQQGLGVLLEHMDSKLDLVVEGHEALDKKIDNMAENMSQKFFEVDQKFDIMKERFDTVDEKFSVVFEELHLIRSDLKEKVSREEFIVLEKRVLMLERKSTERGH